MASVAASFIQVQPSFTEPGIIMPYSQASGAFKTLYQGKPQQKLSEGDLYVYARRLDLRTAVSSGQSAYNSLPSISTTFSQISTPSYLLRVRAEYDHHDTAAVGRLGASIVEIQRLGMRQGHFQLARSTLLYGMNPALGEGLLNTRGGSAITLPPDSNGNDTVRTYDNGEMAFFLSGVILATKTRTNMLGYGKKFTILGPQRTLGQFEYNVVQLTQFQREGAGTLSTVGTLKAIVMPNGDEITWVYDDTLIGKGAGGTDAVLVVMPEIEVPMGTPINTNDFATLQPGLTATSLMYCDMAAPREIPTPLPGGAIDVLSEWRITPGWIVRPEAITIVSMEY